MIKASHLIPRDPLFTTCSILDQIVFEAIYHSKRDHDLGTRDVTNSFTRKLNQELAATRSDFSRKNLASPSVRLASSSRQCTPSSLARAQKKKSNLHKRVLCFGVAGQLSRDPRSADAPSSTRRRRRRRRRHAHVASPPGTVSNLRHCRRHNSTQPFPFVSLVLPSPCDKEA